MTKTHTLIHPVILSGGAGTRLWPMSRALYPKQLMPLVGEKTMLQETALRSGGGLFAAPIVVCNDEHRFIVAEQMRELGVTPQAILLEPLGRNTAPAAAVAALVLMEEDEDALMLLMPSDHVIQNQPAFEAAVTTAASAARAGFLTTFGIRPDKPETGYGYIKEGTKLDGFPGCLSVDRFVEKPDSKTARDYLSEGGYHWNSGIFLFSAKRYLEELERLEPDMVKGCHKALAKARRDLDFHRLEDKAFAAIEGQSIDYAVMEHTEHAAVVPVDMGWNDVGAWSALWDISDKDDCGNVLKGDVIAVDSYNSYVNAGNKLTALVGVDDLVVVVTDDAIMVAEKARAQEVKKVVEALAAAGRDEHRLHTRVYRPWGNYRGIDKGENFQVKQIVVNPGQQLSLQRHQRRAEHWVVVSGVAKVTCGEEVFLLRENESTYIPRQTIHRLENPGEEPVRIIEVQSGDYLGEDDIERLEDVYGRDRG